MSNKKSLNKRYKTNSFKNREKMENVGRKQKLGISEEYRRAKGGEKIRRQSRRGKSRRKRNSGEEGEENEDLKTNSQV
jgi:hypothetical protein